MASRASPPTPSLPTALWQALIAFTIEFDNEFEHRIEHHTGNKAGSGVWLTSMVMWSNFMRLIPAGGVALRAVEANGRITNLDGLQRWGYISVEPADQTVHLSAAHPARWPRTSPRCSRRRYSPSLSSTRKGPPSRLR